MGSRNDIIFKSHGYEFGCLEAGRIPGDTTTKAMDDGCLKLPLTLRDMLAALANNYPCIANKLCTVGYAVMGTRVQLISADIPGGHVCRILRTKRYQFPICFETFQADFRHILELIWKAKRPCYKQYLLHPTPKLQKSDGKSNSLCQFYVAAFCHHQDVGSAVGSWRRRIIKICKYAPNPIVMFPIISFCLHPLLCHDIQNVNILYHIQLQPSTMRYRDGMRQIMPVINESCIVTFYIACICYWWDCAYQDMPF